MATATAVAAPVAAAAAPVKKAPKQLPAPNSDFYQLVRLLNAEELAIVKQVRAFMETKVAPIINKYWVDDAFPFELLPAFKELGIGGLGMQGLRLRRRKPDAVRLCRDGDGAHRPVVLRPSSACTSAWRWARSTSTDRRSRSRSGCRRWRASRRSAASA